MTGILIIGTHSISDWGNLRKLAEVSCKAAAIRTHRPLVRRRWLFPQGCCKRAAITCHCGCSPCHQAVNLPLAVSHTVVMLLLPPLNGRTLSKSLTCLLFPHPLGKEVRKWQPHMKLSWLKPQQQEQELGCLAFVCIRGCNLQSSQGSTCRKMPPHELYLPS